MALNINGTTGISGVDGSVSAPAVTGTDSNTGITFPSADTIKFATGGVERMSITNSGVTGITAGITMADQWRITASFNSSDATLVNNWERHDTYGAGTIGSSLMSTPSSGVFTFPSTGIYQIYFFASAVHSTETRYVGILIKTTTDDSNYNIIANTYDSIGDDANAFSSISCATLFDVTDISTHKVKFDVQAENSVAWEGHTSNSRTSVIFLRLGDT